ncbi:MAG: hypothetical protein SNJ73_03910, partial [Acetobacteraceae bacterium]
MGVCTKRFSSLAFACGLVALTADAMAQPSAISCQALADWLRGYDARNAWRPNGMSSGWLQGHLFRDDVPRVFGKPALDWTPAEARALAARAERCAEEIMSRRVRGFLGPMQGLSGHANDLSQYLAYLAEARARAAAAMVALGESEPTLQLLVFRSVLAGMGDDVGALERIGRAAEAVPDPNRVRAVDLVRALPLLPRSEIEELSRRAEALAAPLVDRFREATLRSIDTGSATRAEAERLAQLARELDAASPAVLPRPIASELAARATARQAEIRRALTDQAVAAVAALPASWETVRELAQFRPEQWERPPLFTDPRPWQADLPVLDAEQRRRVSAAAAARRDTMIEELLSGTLQAIARARVIGDINKAVGTFPPAGAPPEAVQRIER